MKEKSKKICDEWAEKGCRETCPLAEACVMRSGDTRESFDDRMEATAEALAND